MVRAYGVYAVSRETGIVVGSPDAREFLAIIADARLVRRSLNACAVRQLHEDDAE